MKGEVTCSFYYLWQSICIPFGGSALIGTRARRLKSKKAGKNQGSAQYPTKQVESTSQLVHLCWSSLHHTYMMNNSASAFVTLIYGFVSLTAAIETIPSAGPVASLVRFCVVSTYTVRACYKLLHDFGSEPAGELLTGTLSAASPPFLLSVALNRSIRA